MKLSEKLLVVAKWLESEDNELLIEAQESEDSLDMVALSLIAAADSLKDAATNIEPIEAIREPLLTPESLEEMAAIAASFAESDDELLQKQANVLDEILYTLATPKDFIFNFKKAEDDKIETLKKKYKSVKEEIDKENKVAESLEAIKSSPAYKEYRVLEAPLSTRCCIDHPGAQLARIGENQYQCSLDHKIYDFENGFTTLKGDKIPPGSVVNQTPKYNDNSYQIFDTRSERTLGYK